MEALLGTGLSYGYKLPLSEHWGAEFTLGAGYMRASYEKFFNVKNGLLIGSEINLFGESPVWDFLLFIVSKNIAMKKTYSTG